MAANGLDAPKALEAAALILQAWKPTKRIDEEVFDQRYNAVLARRSELETATPNGSRAELRLPMAPEEMPRSRLLSLGGGLLERDGAETDQGFAELQFRLLGHEFLDRLEPGQSSQLELGRVRLRAVEGDGIQLEELTLLELLSVSPHEPVFQRKSWQFRAGLDRVYGKDDQRDELLGLLEGSVGAASGPFYALAGGELRSDLHEHALLGPELTVGAFAATPGRRLRSHLSASLAYHLGTRSDWHPEVRWSSRLRLTPRADVALDAAICSEHVREVRGGIAWNW